MELKEFLNYIQPIASGCSGFIRTVGYITHYPGYLVLMDDEETMISYINIPIIYNIIFTSTIGDIVKMKDYEGDINSFFRDIYFIGWNIKQDHSIKYLNQYKDIDKISKCCYSIDNCFEIKDFEDLSSNSDIKSITIGNNDEFYVIPVSKSITPLNKGDICNLSIYESPNIQYNNLLRVVKYIVYKKKLKINLNIFFTILALK